MSGRVFSAPTAEYQDDHLLGLLGLPRAVAVTIADVHPSIILDAPLPMLAPLLCLGLETVSLAFPARGVLLTPL